MFFFFKQKTAYEMRISDWSSDVCSSDLRSDGEGDRPRSGWWKGPYASVSRLRRLPSPHSLREQGGAFMIRAFRAELLSIGQDPRDALDAVRYEADGLLVVEDGVVVARGAYAALAQTYAEVPTETLPGLVVPGFVDAHIHYPQTAKIASHGERSEEHTSQPQPL